MSLHHIPYSADLRYPACSVELKIKKCYFHYLSVKLSEIEPGPSSSLYLSHHIIRVSSRIEYSILLLWSVEFSKNFLNEISGSRQESQWLLELKLLGTPGKVEPYASSKMPCIFISAEQWCLRSLSLRFTVVSSGLFISAAQCWYSFQLNSRFS